MYIYRSDEMATKGSDSSKYQSTTCSLLDLSSLAITTSVIVPTPYNIHLEHVGTKDMAADGLTKPLDDVAHNRFLYQIGLCKPLLLPRPQEPPTEGN
jgi:hypothetical protein